MYSDRKREGRTWLAWLLLSLLALLVIASLWNSEHSLGDSSTSAIRTAIRRSATQCYAVEGAYPPNLQYLEDNYGLQINHENFYVSYEAFASNLPPTVHVTERRADGS